MKLVEDKGICFVISPIGETGSDTRRRADQVFKHIIQPVAKECGYKAVRADHIAKPGIITSPIIEHLVGDPLVIADLAGHNPNVFYELAIRHVARKPVIQITQVGETIPFDVAPTRTIQLDHRDLESAELCKENLEKQIRSIEKDTSDFDNPISTAIDLQLLRHSTSPKDRGNATMISMLSDLRAMVAQLLPSTTLPTDSKYSRFLLRIKDTDYGELANEATQRGLTIEQLIRKVVVPQWTRSHLEEQAEKDFVAEAEAQAEVEARAQEQAEAEAEAEAHAQADAQAESMQ